MAQDSDNAEDIEQDLSWNRQRPPAEVVEERGQNRYGDSCEDAGERDIAESEESGAPYNQSADACGRGEREDAAGGGGDSLTAFEFKEDGEHVSDDGRDHSDNAEAAVIGYNATGFENDDGDDGQESFNEIEEEAYFAGNGSDNAGNVGCSDIAGALFADVFSVDFTDQQSPRYRSGEI